MLKRKLTQTVELTGLGKSHPYCQSDWFKNSGLSPSSHLIPGHRVIMVQWDVRNNVAAIGIHVKHLLPQEFKTKGPRCCTLKFIRKFVDPKSTETDWLLGDTEFLCQLILAKGFPKACLRPHSSTGQSLPLCFTPHETSVRIWLLLQPTRLPVYFLSHMHFP